MSNSFETFVNQMPLIDCHEHLMLPEQRVTHKAGFFDMLHYIESDLRSAGMPHTLEGLSFEAACAAFATYFPFVQHTGYGRLLKMFASDLYNVQALDEAGLRSLHALIEQKATSRETMLAWYHEVLATRAGITTSLTVYDNVQTAYKQIRFMCYLDYLLMPDCVANFKKKHAATGQIVAVSDYLTFMTAAVDEKLAEGMVCGKFATPYWHDIAFLETPDREAAAREFASEQSKGINLSAMLFYHLLAHFETKGVPIQFHTGHVEPSAADMVHYKLAWSNPDFLGRAAVRYPKLTMVLLHTGFPFTQEYMSLVKNIPNLYADFSWIYMISTTAARHALQLALDMVPYNKIIAFGGDCEQVEMVYAHAKMARRVIHTVLAEQIAQSVMTQTQAEDIVRAICYDNPKRIYALEDTQCCY